jgi:hypothetical protein
LLHVRVTIVAAANPLNNNAKALGS